MKVICISGKAGSGKDTYAGYLTEMLRDDGHKVLVTHYADLLKFVCKQFLGWNGIKDEHGRWLLQHVGTDIVRKRNPDFWCHTLISLIDYLKDIGGWDFVLIPDARFENEITVPRDFGSIYGYDMIHIRVERPEYASTLTEEQKNHPSETDLDDMAPDLIVENSGSLQLLREAAETTVVWMTGEHQMKLEEFYDC